MYLEWWVVGFPSKPIFLLSFFLLGCFPNLCSWKILTLGIIGFEEQNNYCDVTDYKLISEEKLPKEKMKSQRTLSEANNNREDNVATRHIMCRRTLLVHSSCPGPK